MKWKNSCLLFSFLFFKFWLFTSTTSGEASSYTESDWWLEYSWKLALLLRKIYRYNNKSKFVPTNNEIGLNKDETFSFIPKISLLTKENELINHEMTHDTYYKSKETAVLPAAGASKSWAARAMLTCILFY